MQTVHIRDSVFDMSDPYAEQEQIRLRRQQQILDARNAKLEGREVPLADPIFEEDRGIYVPAADAPEIDTPEHEEVAPADPISEEPSPYAEAANDDEETETEEEEDGEDPADEEPEASDDGSDGEDDTETELEVPAQNDLKAVWVEYAAAKTGKSPEEIDSEYSKGDLIEEFGSD